MNNKLRIIFLGARKLGYQCLELLENYHDLVEVALVISRHPKDGEPGSDWDPPLLPLAHQRGYPVLEPDTLKDPVVIRRFHEIRPDVIVMPFCNRIVPSEIID